MNKLLEKFREKYKLNNNKKKLSDDEQTNFSKFDFIRIKFSRINFDFPP